MSSGHKISDLFATYSSKVKGFLLLKYGVGDEAEDIVQEAFQNILNIDDVSSIQNPQAYLFRAASNLALNRIRRNSTEESYLGTLSQDEPVSPLLISQLTANADLQRVSEVIDSLSEKDRQTFMLSRYDGKSYKTIALELGVTVSTVEKRMIKVLSLLRDAVGE